MLILIQKLIPFAAITEHIFCVMTRWYKMFNSDSSVDIISLYVTKSICLKTKMGKQYFIKILVIFSLHLVCSELSLKSYGINDDFIMKLICSVQKFHNQLDNIQSFQSNLNDRLQSLFLIILRSFIANSVNLDALIIRLV